MVAANIGIAHPSPVFVGLLVVTIVFWVAMELRQAANHRTDAAPADGGSRPVIRVCTFVGAVAAVTLGRNVPAAKIEPQALAEWLGLSLLWCGVGLRVWSFFTLGRYFTFTVQTTSDQPVITTGPYRVLRHPSYTGVLFIVTGLGLVLGNWLSVVALTSATLFGIVYRIRVEERALTLELGDAYRDFAATRKRLVPFVW